MLLNSSVNKTNTNFFNMIYTVQGLTSKCSMQDNYLCIHPTTSSSMPSDLKKEVTEATNLSNNMASDDVSLIEDDNISTLNNTENTLNPSPYTIKKETNLEEKLALFLESIQNNCIEQIRLINRNTDDEDLNFYISTLPIVKTLNMDQKIQFRIQIMKLLQSTYNKPNQSSQQISSKVHKQ